VASAVVTPELALRRLSELSSEIRAAVLVAPDGSLAATHPDDPEMGETLTGQAAALLDAADRAAAGGRGTPERLGEVEVTTAGGAVFAVRRGGWVLAAVTGRYPLSSLMRYDLRRALVDLGEERA